MSGINPEKSLYNELQSLYKLIEDMKIRHKAEAHHLNLRIEELEAENKKLEHKITKLENENERLRRIVNNDSSNSSLPPSSDQKPSKAPNEYNSRKETNRRPGGQIGHSSHVLSPADIRSKIKQGLLKREVRVSDKIRLMDRITGHYVVRYVVDVRVVPIVYEYHLPVEEASTMAPVSYGDNIRAMAIDLTTEHSVSIDRTATFLNTLSDNAFNLSHGAISNFLTSFANKATMSVNNITSQLLNSPIVYTDATNVSLNGAQSYIRNQSTISNVLYSSQNKKNLEELDKTGIIGKYAGLFVTDHETAMYNFGTRHAECNAHLIRYLTKTAEEAQNSWATEMITLLTSINDCRRKLKEAGSTSFTTEELQQYNLYYDKIIEKGKEQNKYTQRRFAKREERALLARLIKYKDSYMYFMYDFDVEFTNNMSERDLRKCKNKQKISGGFRSEMGKERYCSIMSVIETLKRRELNTMNGIKRILAGEVLFG